MYTIMILVLGEDGSHCRKCTAAKRALDNGLGERVDQLLTFDQRKGDDEQNNKHILELADQYKARKRKAPIIIFFKGDVGDDHELLSFDEWVLRVSPSSDAADAAVVDDVAAYV